MRRLFLIAAALAACVCWMVAWPSRQAGLPRQRAAPRRARGLKGAAGLPRASLVRANRTTWRLPSGQCVQRAIVRCFSLNVTRSPEPAPDWCVHVSFDKNAVLTFRLRSPVRTRVAALQ